MVYVYTEKNYLSRATAHDRDPGMTGFSVIKIDLASVQSIKSLKLVHHLY